MRAMWTLQLCVSVTSAAFQWNQIVKRANHCFGRQAGAVLMIRSDTSPPATAAPARVSACAAPYLFWPVARREFYQSIVYSALLPLAWGMAVFGFRATWVVAAYFISASLTYLILRKLFQQRLKLTFHQTLAGAFLAAALAYPLLPWYIAAGAGVFMTALLWLTGPVRREGIHLSILAALLVMVIFPAPGHWPLLMRNRLFWGDAAHARLERVYAWPTASSFVRADAVRLRPPAVAISRLYKRIAPYPVSPASNRAMRAAFAMSLPSPAALVLGGVSGLTGTVGLLAIILAGLYLSYRHILRPDSWAIFLAAVLIGLVFCPLSPHVFHHDFWQSLGGIWYLPPERAIALLTYELCSSDFIFASVFILALPGTLPIEPAARRIFLLVAGLAAAFIHRLDVPVPPATTVLLVMQSLSPTMDMLLHKRTWVLRRRS